MQGKVFRKPSYSVRPFCKFYACTKATKKGSVAFISIAHTKNSAQASLLYCEQCALCDFGILSTATHIWGHLFWTLTRVMDAPEMVTEFRFPKNLVSFHTNNFPLVLYVFCKANADFVVRVMPGKQHSLVKKKLLKYQLLFSTLFQNHFFLQTMIECFQHSLLLLLNLIPL